MARNLDPGHTASPILTVALIFTALPTQPEESPSDRKPVPGREPILCSSSHLLHPLLLDKMGFSSGGSMVC